IRLFPESLMDSQYSTIKSILDEFSGYPELASLIAKLEFSTKRLMNELAIKNKDKFIGGHYTKLETLKYLIAPNQDNKSKTKIRLSNVAYMNDPSEGRQLL